MKRFFALVAADMRFQFRYGFYALYALFSAIYIAVVRLLPDGWRESARILVVFSDPAALGLMFMGAILLFEKGERVLKSLAVSPVRPAEYVASKCLSLSVISTVSGFAIALLSGGKPGLSFALGVFLSSVIFSLLGVAVGSRIASLNQFIVMTVPVEIAIFVPAFLRWFDVGPAWLDCHPGALALALMDRTGVSALALSPAVAGLFLVAWAAAIFAIAVILAETLFGEAGKEARS